MWILDTGAAWPGRFRGVGNDYADERSGKGEAPKQHAERLP